MVSNINIKKRYMTHYRITWVIVLPAGLGKLIIREHKIVELNPERAICTKQKYGERTNMKEYLGYRPAWKLEVTDTIILKLS